jgi:uncharacterized protein
MSTLSRMLFITLCSVSLAGSAQRGFAAEREYKHLIWIDLLPLDDYQALLNPPNIDHAGGDSEKAGGLLRNNTASNSAACNSRTARARTQDAFDAALVSIKVLPALNDTAVRLPGYIVPLEYNDNEEVTEFFLVPYFGACIHTPPPPPNQLAYVSYPEGLALESIFDPFFVEGTLFTKLVDNDMATAAYSITADSIYPYTEKSE